MKILVAYYSRTGMTKKVAELMTSKIHADIDVIIDEKDRSGAKGYITGGKDAMKKELTKIRCEKDPRDYDMVIIGGPVWAWTICPAVRTYVDKNSDILKIKPVSFFATQGSNGAETMFEDMQKIIERKPLNTLIVNSKDFRNGEYEKKVENFILPLTAFYLQSG